MDLSENSLLIVQSKYLQKDDLGRIIETPEQWLKRVARAISSIEVKKKFWEKKFYEVMENLEFLPGGRTLANAGTVNGQLANCFVLPFEDNIEEIFEVVKESAILKKNGGGVGFSFSKIRPKGDGVATTTGKACGPVALMKVLDACSEILLQDGGRRSGNMVVLSVSHPDVLEFISCKDRDSELNQINYSLGITDKFMAMVVKNKDWELVNPRTGKVVNKIKARTIFDLASEHAWKNGDPGMIFLDRINRDNPTPHVGVLEAVNLCGEQPLLAYEACNLGSININKFIKSVVPPRGSQIAASALSVTPEESLTVDFDRLAEVVKIAVRFLDDVISVCRYPVSKVDRVVKANRKIGLGIMGWADLLINLKISYDSNEALELAEKVMKFIRDTAWETSEKLGREKGNFPNFNGSLWQKKGFKHFRNATLTTIAPTGSISLVGGVSSGIEPVFAREFARHAMGGKVITQKHPKHAEKYFKSAMEIAPIWHVRMQAAFQKYTDNAVSKTINLPEEAKVSDVEEAFMQAFKLGCKGITVYRDKSKGEQVLNADPPKAAHLGGLGANCPQCGTKLVIEEACEKCPNCGWGKCSV